MSIEGVKIKLNNLVAQQRENDMTVAKSFDESLFYSKDVVCSTAFLQKLDSESSNIISSAEYIKNKIDDGESSFYKTYDDLRIIISKLSEFSQIIEEVINYLKNQSQTSFDTYNGKYNTLKNEVNSKIDDVNQKIKKYNECESKIDFLRREIRLATDSTNMSTLEKEKSRYEGLKKRLISTCESLLSDIEHIHKSETELLKDGLKKV